MDDGAIKRAVVAAGGSEVRVWPTTVLALADGQTRALTVAARVAADPEELPMALAELLGARVRPTPAADTTDDPDPGAPQDLALRDTRLRVLVPDGEPVILDRPGDPFTPAEAARADRLAQLTRPAHAHRH
ncbi:hypothetical protein ACI79D_03185 [Geodermatophilus sp. SYSU D00708]